MNFPAPRRATRAVRAGTLVIGGGAPISVQSMTRTDTTDVERTVAQIQSLEEGGCELIRLAVPDMRAAKSLGAIRRRVRIPMAADIHFNHRLALEALAQGVDKLRLNPGNLRRKEDILCVAHAAEERGVPIRVGVNAGSLDPEILARRGGITASGLVESAMKEIRLLEEAGFSSIIVSLKASDVPTTVEAYRLLSRKVDYPFHIGITEAGPSPGGLIISSVGIGALLAAGIGDTVRVSLTGPPSEEVWAGYEILKALQLRQKGPVLISCPTCGRTGVNLVDLVSAVRERIAHLKAPLHIAVMGCVVNGPGEARAADIGIAAGRGKAVIFRRGEVLRTVRESEMLEELIAEVEKIADL